MAARKNHHFVPQFYFRRFSSDGRSICALQVSSGKFIENSSIKCQASKTWFYGDDIVEQELGTIEGICSSVLRKMDDVQSILELDENEVTLLLIWLTLQRSRTEAARRSTEASNARLLQLYMEVAVNNDESLDERTKDQLIGSLNSLYPDPVQPQLMQMTGAMQSSAVLRDLAPILLTNKTNRPFIFGDAPVVLYNGYYRDVKLRGVLGFDTPGLLVIYPLSPSLCLMLVDPECYKVKRLRENQIVVKELADVAALNKLQLHSATSCVYFNDKRYGAYVYELWREERPYLTEQLMKVIEVPGFSSETGEPLGDVFHTFQPQLPYRFRLSFLAHAVVGDTNYRFSRRSDRQQSST